MPRSAFAKASDAIDRLFMPPFRGLSVIVWIVLIVVFPLYATNGIRFGTLQDPDDYLYLIQAMDWLNGQGWFDLVQHRMNPPEGVYVHFSHILSAFYACLIFIVHPFFGYLRAGVIVAAIVPPLFFVLFLVTIQWAARTLIDKEWTGITSYVILFSVVTLSQFVPGHIDHHGLEILLAVTVYGCLARMTLHPTEHRWALWGGLTLAFALVIGLEILPMLLIFSAWVGLQAVVKGGLAARNGLFFGLSLFASSITFLLVTLPPNALLTPDVMVFSSVYVFLSGGIALCFAGVAAVAHRHPKAPLRYLTGCGLALITGVAFIYAFPNFREGPYGGMDPALQKLMFAAEPEAQPVIQFHEHGVSGGLIFLWPIVALIGSVVFLFRSTETPRRWLWGLFVLILTFSILLAAFYQSRMLTYVYSFSIIPLAYAIWRDWLELASPRAEARINCIVRLAVIFLIGPLTLMLAPAGMGEDHAVPEASATAVQGCGTRALARILDDPATYGDHSRLIINSINEGVEILYRTPHKVLAAPFIDVSGNVDVFKFFTAHNPAEAEAIARRRGAELIAFCALPRPLNIYLPDQTNITPVDKLNFLQQLIFGQVPSWLVQVKSPALGSMMLFKILPPPISERSKHATER
jgi:hypothetical protein